MSGIKEIRKQLTEKLKELFQLDQPDLDFGFYRIMHAKASEVRDFIEDELSTIVGETFDECNEDHRNQLKARFEQEIENAKRYNSADPDGAPDVQEAKAAYEAFKSMASTEESVYEHLLNFFSRYYETGDFISRRYYARENKQRAAAYAIPYNGEEVKLHWTNADQYYIKSTDYFSNYTFDIGKALQDGTPLFEEEKAPLLVHFRVVDVEGEEHGDVKPADRRFFLYRDNPIEISDEKELIVNFRFLPKSEEKNLSESNKEKLKKRFDAKKAGDLPLLALTAEILDLLPKINGLPSDYHETLSMIVGTSHIAKRPLLAKYLYQYTARNTADYFIHKNLGDFLHRELDFYIKND